MKSGTIFTLVSTIILISAGFFIVSTRDLPHCPNCNKQINEVYDIYCPYCGYKIDRDSIVWYDEIDRMKKIIKL